MTLEQARNTITRFIKEHPDLEEILNTGVANQEKTDKLRDWSKKLSFKQKRQIDKAVTVVRQHIVQHVASRN